MEACSWGICSGKYEPGPSIATMDSVLDFLYSREYSEEQGIRKEGGRGASSLTVPEWIGKVRELFPAKQWK